jgi:hypothetical protein
MREGDDSGCCRLLTVITFNQAELAKQAFKRSIYGGVGQELGQVNAGDAHERPLAGDRAFYAEMLCSTGDMRMRQVIVATSWRTVRSGAGG